MSPRFLFCFGTPPCRCEVLSQGNASRELGPALGLPDSSSRHGYPRCHFLLPLQKNMDENGTEVTGSALLVLCPFNICRHPPGDMDRIGVISADSWWFISTELDVLAV